MLHIVPSSQYPPFPHGRSRNHQPHEPILRLVAVFAVPLHGQRCLGFACACLLWFFFAFPRRFARALFLCRRHRRCLRTFCSGGLRRLGGCRWSYACRLLRRTSDRSLCRLLCRFLCLLPGLFCRGLRRLLRGRLFCGSRRSLVFLRSGARPRCLLHCGLFCRRFHCCAFLRCCLFRRRMLRRRLFRRCRSAPFRCRFFFCHCIRRRRQLAHRGSRAALPLQAVECRGKRRYREDDRLLAPVEGIILADNISRIKHAAAAVRRCGSRAAPPG